jgi:ATP-dependent Clp protease ATP-binding subunit ClpX
MLKLRKLRCSFCGKNEDKVLKLVAGRRGFICDECASIAHDIMSRPPDNLPKESRGTKS